MNRENPPNKNVPRVEYDHRARDARLRLERVERLLVGSAVAEPRQFWLLRRLGFRVANGRAGGANTGSSRYRRPSDIPMPVAA
jgi:hypothetical protein